MQAKPTGTVGNTVSKYFFVVPPCSKTLRVQWRRVQRPELLIAAGILFCTILYWISLAGGKGNTGLFCRTGCFHFGQWGEQVERRRGCSCSPQNATCWFTCSSVWLTHLCPPNDLSVCLVLWAVKYLHACYRLHWFAIDRAYNTEREGEGYGLT